MKENEMGASGPLDGAPEECVPQICCRCHERRSMGVSFSGLKGDPESDMAGQSGVVQLTREAMYPETIYETMDEFDEFEKCATEHQGSIQEGENPPFVASFESLTKTHSSLKSSSSSIGQEKPQGTFSKVPRRPRLVKMDEAVERLWDLHDDGLYDEENRDAAMRTSFYRPSMIQSTKRTDVDLTATWHGDMNMEMVDIINEGARKKPPRGSKSSSRASSKFSMGSSRFSRESSLRSFSSRKIDMMHTCDVDINRDYLSSEGSAKYPELPKATPSDALWTPRMYGTGIPRWNPRKTLEQPGSPVASSGGKLSTKWTRCVAKLKRIKQTIVKGNVKEINHAPKPPSGYQGKSEEKGKKKQCLSCLRPVRPSDVSSDYQLSFRGTVPRTSSFDSPFLTTSALFDDRAFSPTGSSVVRDHDMDDNLPSGRCALDISDLWEDSDIASSRGSFMMTRKCWAPPVLKTDQEYEASRIRNAGSQSYEYEKPEPKKKKGIQVLASRTPTHVQHLPVGTECGLSTQSSWDFQSDVWDEDKSVVVDPDL
ncbi:hypothetical protein BSKO_10059 [Bryopsis sp. KO-2023]|nr:hypothetical protein BSKO_10059 [Bryopsis sp. KO-2023]